MSQPDIDKVLTSESAKLQVHEGPGSLSSNGSESESPKTRNTSTLHPALSDLAQQQQLNSSSPLKQSDAPRRSLLSKIFHFLVPCVSPSSKSHIIEPHDVSPRHAVEEKTVPKLVPLDKPLESNGHAVEKLNEEDTRDLDAPVTILPPITPSQDEALALPPTPTTPHLLPPDETEGVTSGAVQPPGSKGDSPTSEKPYTVPLNENEESEDTSYSEEEDIDEQDEEDKLIQNGGAGIPIGPDGVPRPLLPPISPQHVGRKCLVLDLDETLVHSSFKSISQADYVVPVEIEYHWHNVYVIKRPGVDNFLKRMGEIYEIVVFTASLSKYADPVLDKLDIHQVVSHRLFRESCYNHKGNYVKDLSQLGRPIADTIILDNSPASYIFHPNNAVPVSSWFNDPHDTELTDLVPFLADLSPVDDVRGILDGAR